MLDRPWYNANDTEENNRKAKRIYESLMTITLRKPDSAKYRLFSDEVKMKAQDKDGHSVYGDDEASSHAADVTDATQ